MSECCEVPSGSYSHSTNRTRGQNVIKPDSVFLPEEAAVIAIGQGVGFGEAELRQGCDLIQWKALKALLFVCGDPYVLNDVLSGRLRVFVQGLVLLAVPQRAQPPHQE